MSDKDEPKTETQSAADASDDATKAAPAAAAPADDAPETESTTPSGAIAASAVEASAAASAAAPAAAAPKAEDLPTPPTASPRSHASPPPVPTGGGSVAQDKPEVLVAAAFGGAFVLAQILKRITR